ncbi:MAG: porin [Tangfeifania sp.]
MIKKSTLFCLFFLMFFPGFSQDENFEPAGSAFATIFANFHGGITGSATDEAAFELVRGYLGYEYRFSPEYSAKINVDVGSPDDLSPVSRIRRYAYFKNAYLRYTKSYLQVDFGLISLRQFKLQENIWERRYLMKTLADEHRLGSSADLGMNVHYKFSEIIDADFTVVNGEGYTSLQMDDIFKYSLGTTIRIPRNFSTRVVYDIMHDEISETTLLFFTSYDFRKKWNIAAEFILRQNDEWRPGHDIYGLSVFGKYNLNGKYQLFARYDKIESNILAGENIPWNLAEDGSALVAGIQYNPVKDIKMALNYHDWQPWAANVKKEAFVFLNLGIKI